MIFKHYANVKKITNSVKATALFQGSNIIGSEDAIAIAVNALQISKRVCENSGCWNHRLKVVSVDNVYKSSRLRFNDFHS